LPDRPKVEGCDKKSKTFLIWEGTTPYITAQALDEPHALTAEEKIESTLYGDLR
jgi:O-methyltransferase involved in polyketide biosynthesis